MLENIKSSYLVKNLFSILEERKKLEIVKYNKHKKNKFKFLQNLFSIQI